MIIVVVTVAGAIASIIGAFALYETRRSRRQKLLLYEASGSLPLATASRVEGDYKLSIRYERSDEDVEIIDAAYLAYLRFANFGREPIRRDDIAPANPLRIVVEGSRVLDISLASQGRDVCRVEVGSPEITEEEAAAYLSFDFLDYHDGGVVRILSTTPQLKVRLVGDVIGMPGGMDRSDEVPAGSLWGKVGFGLWLLATLGAFALAAYVTQRVAGSWTDIWLLALPIAAVVLPIIGAFALSETVWPSSRRRKYPAELSLPGWLGSPIRGIGVGGDPTPPWMYLLPPLEADSADDDVDSTRTQVDGN